LILYKYTSFEDAKKILETSSIGFSCPKDLNDPFECTSFGFQKNPSYKNSISTVIDRYKKIFSSNYAILSLTKKPLNSLMWSHYGDSHQGVVIGIDINDAPLTDTETSIIPAQYGEVVYSSTKPKDAFEYSADELLDIMIESVSFESNIYNILKRAFLYKSLEWAYEEEVRVVKNIYNPGFNHHSITGEFNIKSGRWNKIKPKNICRPVYCLKIPSSSFKEIYIGRYAYLSLVNRKKDLSRTVFYEQIQEWIQKDLKVFHIDIDSTSWSLKYRNRIRKIG
jgi:hypothetical protein